MFKIQGKIHPKIYLRAQRLAVLGVAAEGLGSLIYLWIFRYFSSLSFAKISSSSVALSLRRERTSLATLAQAVPSPLPLFLPRSTSQGLQALRRAAAPSIWEGAREGGEGALPWSPLRSKKPTWLQVGIFKVRGTKGR